MIVRIVCGGGNDPYDRDDYMETRLKLRGLCKDGPMVPLVAA